MPPWLLAWAARWGVTTRGSCIKLVQVQAFSGGGCGGDAQQQEPARTLFLPIWV
jgi:hypothetical protein